MAAYTPSIQLTYSEATKLRQRVQREPLSHEDLHTNNTARAAQVHAPTMQWTATYPQNYQNQQMKSNTGFHLVTHDSLLFQQLCIHPSHQF